MKLQGEHPPSPSHTAISQPHSNPTQPHPTFNSNLNPRYEPDWETEEGILKLSEFQSVVANQYPDSSEGEVAIRATFEIGKCNVLTVGIQD